MDERRWTVWTLVVLAAAVVPGAVGLLPQDRDLDRALVFDPISERQVPAVAAEAPQGAVPIQPPPEVLTGEVAPAVPVPEPFDGSRAGVGEVFALVVGIDDYPGRGADLRWAGADATTIDAALAGFGVPPANRMVLRDGQARRDGLMAAVRALVERAGPGTTIVFAYAGHVRKLDRDTEAIVAADGALVTDAELAELLAPARSEALWVLMASCYAGGFTEVLAPGRILTGAADARSLAYESSEVGGSYLVHHLVREGWLQGQAGPSVEEAFAYAEARTQGSPERTPVQFDQVDGPLLLGDAAVTGPSADGSPPSSSPSTGPGGGAGAAPPAPPSTTTTTTRPERDCRLLVLC